ncbi:DUF3617 family protein [Desulfococcaceae bacterium HSG9]|nr:DUF3617 family protein [Desulfococcaceae bacterium HSG9]
MFVKKKMITLIIVALTCLTANADAVDMQDGNWEITVQAEIQGTSMKLPPMTYTQCLTSQNVIPMQSKSGQECEFIEKNVSGNPITWKMRCTGQGMKMDIDGKVNYQNTSFSGNITMRVNNPDGEKTVMKQKISGKRTGDCN